MAKAIMIQGTMSNVGKSLLAAGLCRIFAQDGYRTAPFKSQNMALNSYITQEGLEMGRAQAVQAEAAGILPAADMNPILLKPTTDVGSQVIVNGVPIGNMKAREYFSYKKELIPAIQAAYGRLAAACDIIVIEGAGSPAEINLNQEDIVNMGMAAMAQAPVLLAGDIDRGGVFAQLYGTVSLLKEEERRRVKGIIINKFRGDKTILEPGIKMLEELCGLPVLGAVPYMDVDLEDEDSLGDGLLGAKKGGGLIDIAVIRFPRISNFTDFNVFSAMEEVNLRYVQKAGELGNPDLVILPGTKNTISDLLWLRQSGLEAAILKLAGRQTPVWGICGGYQMLGEELLDPEGSESGQPGMRAAGMGLLPAVTVFQADKVRTQAEGSFGELDGVFKGLSGHPAKGYEIHMGRTSLKEGLKLEDTARRADYRLEPEICRPLSWLMETQSGSKRAKQDGLNRGNVYGTYLHGVFDGEGVARQVAELLSEKKGVKLCGFQEMDYRAYRQRQYDRLAEGLRESLDMGQIYRIMGL